MQKLCQYNKTKRVLAFVLGPTCKTCTGKDNCKSPGESTKCYKGDVCIPLFLFRLGDQGFSYIYLSSRHRWGYIVVLLLYKKC